MGILEQRRWMTHRHEARLRDQGMRVLYKPVDSGHLIVTIETVLRCEAPR